MESSNRPSEQFLLVHKPSLGQNLWAIITCVIVIAVIRWPAFQFINSRFLGGTTGDSGLYVWLSNHFSTNLFSTPWFQTPAFYPYGDSLAWSDNFLLPGFIAWCLAKISVSPELAYNLIILVSTLLSGYLTFRVAFSLSGHFAGSLCAGTFFLASAFVSGMLGHPQLQFTFFFPLAALCFIHWVAGKNFLWAALLGGTVSLCFLTTVYYAIFLAIMIACLMLGLIIVRPKAFSKKELLVFGAGVGLGLIPVLPTLPPYFRVREVFGERALYEAFYFAANAFSFISAPIGSLLYRSSTALSHEEARLFPGFILLAALAPTYFRLIEAKPLKKIGYTALFAVLLTLLFSFLAAVENPQTASSLRYACALSSWCALLLMATMIFRMGLLERKLGFSILTNRALSAVILFATFISFAIALGPLGNPEKGQWAFGIHRLWYEILPGFNSIRAISRIGIVWQFLLALNLALIIPHLCKKWPRYSKAVFVLPALIVAENYIRYIPIEPAPAQGRAYEMLAAHAAEGGAVIELPFAAELNPRGEPSRWGEFARLQVDAMNRTLQTGLAAVNGYSGQRSKIMREWPAQLTGFPDQRSVQTLCTIAGLRFVVFASKLVPDFDQLSFIKKTANLSAQLKYVDTDELGNYLFELPCQSVLSERTLLLAPSNAPGVVTVEVMAQLKKSADPFEVIVSSSDGAVSFPLSVKPSGEWELFSIPVPQSPDRIRPARLAFRVPNDKIVYMRNPLYQRIGP